MNVEVRKETVTHEIEVRTFIANDGARFEDSKLCELYEKNLLRNELATKLSKIETCEEAKDHTPLDGGEYYESHDYRWYRPKTRAEADTLCEFFKIEMGIGDSEIGDWICVEAYDLEDVGEGCWASHISGSIAQIKRLFNFLGYDVTIEKR